MGMFKTTLLYTFLVTLLLSMHPLIATGAPQNTDINKPTRERVNKNNKKDDKNSKNNKKDDKNASKDAAAKKDEDKKKAAATKGTTTENNKNKPAATKPADTKNKPAAAKSADTKNNVPAKANDGKNATAKPANDAKKDEVGKPIDKKDVKAKDANAPANDTAKKAANAQAPKVPMDPNVVQFDGIDVSKHQGTINWAELKKFSKIKFVYIKATEGADYIDPRYQENIRNAKMHGFKVGSYHFLSTKSSAVKQFQNFIKTAKREEQDLLPVIDVEKIRPWSSQQLRDSLKVFADLLEDYYGCKPLIYTSEKFFTTNLGRAFANYPLFIAKYSNVAPNINYPWVMWQFSDCGIFKSAVRENRGEVDMSRFAKGHSINDILYVPSKHKPKNPSVIELVEHKEKPTTVNMTEQKPKEATKPTKADKQTKADKKQEEEAKKKAEKDRKKQDRDKRIADQERQKKLDQEKKEREKAEAQQKADARKKAHDAELQRQAQEKAQRKEAARQIRQKQQQEKNAKQGTKKATSLMQTNSSKLNQSQRNDSIRAAKQKGHKTNLSTPDND